MLRGPPLWLKSKRRWNIMRLAGPRPQGNRCSSVPVIRFPPPADTNSFVDDLDAVGGVREAKDLEGAAKKAIRIIANAVLKTGIQMNHDKTAVLMLPVGKGSKEGKAANRSNRSRSPLGVKLWQPACTGCRVHPQCPCLHRPTSSALGPFLSSSL